MRAPDPTPYEYPEHLRPALADLPHAPGVYLFRDDAHDMPLYIGKSVDIRSRVMAHLRTAAEARLLRQARRIDCIRTAGDLGAQLLEARLIKQLQPLHNKRLRRQRRLCSIRLGGDGRPEIVESHQRAPDGTLYGVYGSRHAAVEALRAIADEAGLCYGRLGIEPVAAGQPCFRAQLGKCRGICCHREPVPAHDERLRHALNRLRLAIWPYDGPVAIVERGEDMRQLHVVDNWHYLGSADTLRAARKLQTPAPGFDRDGYHILAGPLLAGRHEVIPLCSP
jgi:Excinuclease Cho